MQRDVDKCRRGTLQLKASVSDFVEKIAQAKQSFARSRSQEVERRGAHSTGLPALLERAWAPLNATKGLTRRQPRSTPPLCIFPRFSGACGRAGIRPAKEWRHGQTDRKAAQDAAETTVQ